MPIGGHTRGRQMYKCVDCKKKQAADAEQHHCPEYAKRQAVQMCVECTSLPATARVVGASISMVSGWIKEVRLHLNGYVQ